jgi:hypothetical protein
MKSRVRLKAWCRPEIQSSAIKRVADFGTGLIVTNWNPLKKDAAGQETLRAFFSHSDTGWS